MKWRVKRCFGFSARCISGGFSLRLLAVAVFCLPVVAQTGISTNGPLTVLQTGGIQSAISLSVPFPIVPTNSPVLEFDFGFATSEPEAADSLFDSFSVTLQNEDSLATALLLTADRDGVVWSPANPGGLVVTNVPHTPTNFASATASLPLPIEFAFSISFALPPELITGPLNLFFDLFDNLNESASLAYVSNARLESTTPVVPLTLKLESAAEVSGPYVEDPGATLDATSKTFSVPNLGARRFFRIRGSQTTKITAVHIVTGEFVIEFSDAINL